MHDAPLLFLYGNRNQRAVGGQGYEDNRRPHEAPFDALFFCGGQPFFKEHFEISQ